MGMKLSQQRIWSPILRILMKKMKDGIGIGGGEI